MLDGVVLARKTGAGALRRPVLVALGILPDGRKEIIDFQLARAESAAEWERLLTSLHRRGLTGEGLEMICVDGGNGLLAALPFVYPAVQHCWVHKIRNVLNKVRKTDHKDVKRHLHDVMNASNCGAARTAASPRQDTYPKAVPARRPRRPPRGVDLFLPNSLFLLSASSGVRRFVRGPSRHARRSDRINALSVRTF